MPPRQRHNSSASSSHNRSPSPPLSTPAAGQEMASMYDYLAKVILIGTSGSGKSCLLHRFVKNEWRVLTSQTIGVEFASKIVKIGSPSANPRLHRRRIKLQLWDTAGTERFRSVSRSYYRGAAAALLVYDVGNPQSLRDLHTFLQDARALAGPHLTLILVGNKADLADPNPVPYPPPSSFSDDDNPPASLPSSIPPFPRHTTTAQPPSPSTPTTTLIPSSAAHAWAHAHSIPATMEVSALSGAGVDELFTKLAATVLTKLELGEIDPADPLSGIQYGDADYWRFDDDGASSFRDGGGLVSDGFTSGAGSRRRRRGRLWGGAVRLSGAGAGVGAEGRCC